MARLQTVLLPNGGFTYILDQYTPPVVEGIDPARVQVIEYECWKQFASTAGARGILFTAGTVEVLNPFENDFDDDEDDDDHDFADVAPIRLRTPSEAERRLLAAIFGECDCATDAKHPPTDDESATDNPQSGEDGTPAETGAVRQPCGCMPSADLARAAFDAADHPTPDDIAARVTARLNEPDGLLGKLTEREQRIGKILGARQPMITVTPIDGEGNPTGASFTGPVSAVIIDGERVPLSGDQAPAAPSLMCPAENSQGLGCSLERKHEGLHDFAITRSDTEAAPGA